MLTKTPTIRLDSKKNVFLDKILTQINQNLTLLTIWKIININAVDRIGFSDHGIMHSHIVSNIAMRLLRMLNKANIEPSIVKDHGLTYEHAELVVLLASLFHDFGMAIERDGHEELGLFIVYDHLNTLLSFLDEPERTIVKMETLHAIISHRAHGKPLTLEAGIVRVADALDMNKGRSRIPFSKGQINIHLLSAFAIDNVNIKTGKDVPIEVTIHMNNSSGIFQVDNLLKEKIQGSGLEKYLKVSALTVSPQEKNLISTTFNL